MKLPQFVVPQVKPQHFFGIGIFLVVSLIYVNLVFRRPEWKVIHCPRTYYLTPPVDQTMLGIPMVNCSALFENDQNETVHAHVYRKCTPKVPSEEDYIQEASSCSKFISDFGYRDYQVSQEEKDFPLAFSILTFENVAQTERLLRAVYRPQNFYCIHVDQKSDDKFKAAVEKITECFDNVFLASRTVSVQWAEITVVEAELNCMRDLLLYQKWKYYINLTGREYPIRTNWELVQILKAYNGSNDIDGTLHRRAPEWTSKKWVYGMRTWIDKDPPPDGFNVAKGSTHILATRGFVEFAVLNKSAQRLFQWLGDTYAPDEHFFATLNHNPQLGVPGAYKGDPDLKQFRARYKVWQNKHEHCDGTWWRFICNFGVGDLFRVILAQEPFVNKFRIEFDALAYDCMEHWYMERAKAEIRPNFDVTFYKKQKWVNNHS